MQAIKNENVEHYRCKKKTSEQPEEYQRQSMDSKKYLRLEQNTAGGARRQSR